MCSVPAHADDTMKVRSHFHNIGYSSVKPLAGFTDGE